jgi:hypothetical protein
MSAWLILLHLLFFGQTIPSPGPGTVFPKGAAANSDNFVDTNGTALATHNSNWVTMPNAGLVANCEIQSNEVRTTGAFLGCSAMYNISSSDASQITFSAFSDTIIHKSVCVRANVDAGANKTGYCARLANVSGGNWTNLQIEKGGAFLDIYGISAATTSSHTVKITASGTSPVTLTVFLDGSSLGVKTDSSSPYGTGKPGFWMVGDGDQTLTGMSNWTDAP